jgi:propionate CoA-transferase
MNAVEKARILAHVVKWRLTWNRRNLEYRVEGIDNPKFMTAMEAVKLIPDNAVTFSAGMAANMRPSVWFWAIERSFRETGHPRGLTHIVVGAQGGRGRVPGTLEELGKHPGLVTRFIAGHLETVKSFLQLADQGRMELHTMPQGVETFLLEAQARGGFEIETSTGVGTFLDPRIGSGTAILPGHGQSLCEPSGDKLRFRLPPVDVAYFVAPAADREGNIYVRNCAMHTESRESALAAKTNNGKVLVSVAEIIPKDKADIFLPADKVDAVVVHPYNEQTGSVPQRKYWKMFTQGAQEDINSSMAKLRYINKVLGITPQRGPVEDALARLGAHVFTRFVAKCANIVIGVGMPEEVARLIYEGGLFADISLISETGVIGGLPAPGIFFGAGINPKEILTSAQTFHLCYDHLDAAILGILEVDSLGNVNVSRRGDGAQNYVGPGGFPDFCASADVIIFVGAWMAHSRMTLENGRLKILNTGTPKFVDEVREVTMSGAMALKNRKTVLYVTNVGVFRLTPHGMMLIEIMPGLDVRQDIINACPMRITLPPSGQVPVVPEEVVTGHEFKLAWQITDETSKRISQTKTHGRISVQPEVSGVPAGAVPPTTHPADDRRDA